MDCCSSRLVKLSFLLSYYSTRHLRFDILSWVINERYLWRPISGTMQRFYFWRSYVSNSSISKNKLLFSTCVHSKKKKKKKKQLQIVMALKSFNQFAKTFFLCKILFKKFVDIAYSRYACTAGLHFVLPSYLPYLSTCATKYLLVACVKNCSLCNFRLHCLNEVYQQRNFLTIHNGKMKNWYTLLLYYMKV